MSSEFVPFQKVNKKSLVPAGAQISDYKTPALSEGKAKSYTQIKSTFEPENVLKSQNSRFNLSELVSNQLSVEEDERRRFEKRVSETVAREVEKIRDTVLSQARAEGYEAGRKEAYELERARLARSIEGLLSLTHSLEKAKGHLAQQYEDQLLNIAYRLARLVTHFEIEERPQVVSKTMSEILARISKDDDVVIKICEHEFESLDLIKEELQKLSRNGRINFELNEMLNPGDCVVESISGEIASFIDLKFEKLHKVLFRKEDSTTGIETSDHENQSGETSSGNGEQEGTGT
jgi:flagellar assembly protein FliH